MTLLSPLFEVRANPSNGDIPLTMGSLLEWFAGPKSDSGITVNEKTSLASSAVYRSVALLSGVAASLPLKAYYSNTRQSAPSRLLDSPHSDLTPFEFWRLTYIHRLLWGNFYGYYNRDGVGRTNSLQPLEPSRMKVGRSSRGAKVYDYTDSAGQAFTFGDGDLLHLPGLGFDGTAGVSPVRLAMQAIGMGLAAEKYGAKFFGQGSLLAGILTTTNRLQQEDADRLQSRWASSVGSGLANAHKVPVLDSGATFLPMTMPHDEAQFLESRKFQVEEIARWYGIPPHMIGEVDRSTSWGTGIEQQTLGFVQYTLAPDWLVPTEQRVTQSMTGSGVYVKYKIEGLLRGDSASRAAFYKTMREIGAYDVNEIRDLEDMDPVEGGDVRLQPLNMAPLGTPPTPAGSPPA